MPSPAGNIQSCRRSMQSPHLEQHLLRPAVAAVTWRALLYCTLAAAAIVAGGLAIRTIMLQRPPGLDRGC